MNRHTLNRGRLVVAAATAVMAVAAPAAHAAGGAISHRYAPPPLDAGSALPNPVYVHGGVVTRVYAPPPLDAGSALPNPVYVGAVRLDDRANRPLIYGKQRAPVVRVETTSDGFDWRDGAVGAGAGLMLAAVAVGAVALTHRNRRRTVPGT
jgi:hypothetical protein